MPVWNEIVQRNAAKVLNAALRVLGNLADAEDVSQEVGSLYRGFSKVESCAGTAMGRHPASLAFPVTRNQLPKKSERVRILDSQTAAPNKRGHLKKSG